MSELKWRGKEAEARVRAAVPAALEAAALVVEGKAKQLIVSQDIIDTGNLLNSMTHKVEGNTAKVGTPVEYGVYQEFGATYENRSLRPRPFLRPALDENKAEIRKVFAAVLRRALS